MAYLAARNEEKQIQLYGMDLVWLIAKHYYDGLEQPSEIYFKRKKKDRRSGKQIINDLMKKLGGE